jgi:hypothetical protein
VGLAVGEVAPARARQLRLLAVVLLVLGALGWLAFAAATEEPWLEALIEVTVWAAVALLGWRAPLLAALLLFLGAAFGALEALMVFLADSLSQIGSNHADVGPGEFWMLFGWWTVLPVAAALLFIAAYRERLRSTSGSAGRGGSEDG